MQPTTLFVRLENGQPIDSIVPYSVLVDMHPDVDPAHPLPDFAICEFLDAPTEPLQEGETLSYDFKLVGQKVQATPKVVKNGA